MNLVTIMNSTSALLLLTGITLINGAWGSLIMTDHNSSDVRTAEETTANVMCPCS